MRRYFTSPLKFKPRTNNSNYNGPHHPNHCVHSHLNSQYTLYSITNTTDLSPGKLAIPLIIHATEEAADNLSRRIQAAERLAQRPLRNSQDKAMHPSPQQPGITCTKNLQTSGNIAVTLSRVFVKDLPFTLQVSRPIIKPSQTFAHLPTLLLSTWTTHRIHQLRISPHHPDK